MSNEELDAIAADEGFNADPAKPEEQFEDAPEAIAEDGAPEGVIIEREQLEMMAAGAVGAISDIMCRRARVTPLEDVERQSLGVAFANLAIVYDLADKANPKVMAWAGVGLALGGVLANREPLYVANDDKPEDGYPDDYQDENGQAEIVDKDGYPDNS